jgi:hypothetical protein
LICRVAVTIREDESADAAGEGEAMNLDEPGGR